MYATRSRKVKTDKRDARTLAEACRLGAYRPAYRTSDEQRHVRAQLAVREAMVRTRSRYISVICTLLRRGSRVAVVALARKLAGILFAMWRDATSFTVRTKSDDACASAAA